MTSPDNVRAHAPLAGVRILDLTRLLPGPLATQHLADYGAEVIKVEDTGAGDYARSMGAMGGDTSWFYQVVNRNKRSLRLDLKQAEGRALFLRLVETADVVVEGFRPGVMARLGLGLSIVRRLTDLLGLPLTLRSRPGLGSVFAIELPAARPQGAQRRETRALDSFEGVCVLLVDGARHEHDALAELLTTWGCVIDDAPVPVGPSPVADAPTPDILIADQGARGPSATLELLACIRARPGLDALPAILLDDAPSADSQARARAAGAHLLGKPVRPARLRALMHRLLGVEEGPPAPPA